MHKISRTIIDRVKRQNSMEKAILFLRSLDYFFVDANTFNEDYPEFNGHGSESLDFSYMVRKVHPKNLPVFSIKLLGKKQNRIGVAIFSQDYFKTIKLPWERKKIVNFKKMTIHWTFPAYLTHKERRDWRAEWRRLQNNPTQTPSKFYTKVLPDVVFLQPFIK